MKTTLKILTTLAIVLSLGSCAERIENPEHSATETISSPAETVQPVAVNNSAPSLGDLKIAFINNDSLNSKYAYFKEMTADLEAKEGRIRMAIQTKQKNIEAEFEKVKMEAPAMGDNELMREQQRLAALEQEFYQYGQQQEAELVKFQSKMMKDYSDKTLRYINSIGKDLGYHLILNQTLEHTVLYGDPSLNITDTIVSLLNERYKSDKIID